MRNKLESEISNLKIIANDSIGKGHIYICTITQDNHKAVANRLLNILNSNTDCKSWSTYSHASNAKPRNKTKGWPDKTIIDTTVCMTHYKG